MYRQKNITINNQQREIVEANHGKIRNRALAKMIGVTYNVLHKNLVLMGKVKTRQAPVIKMEGYFDEKSFFKKYKY